MIGTTISHYRILEKLGEGGMGVVYKAQDSKLDRLVALKFLPEHVASSAQDSTRFLQEARAAAALNHPNICTIHGIEEVEGRNFIVMEFVDGQMLQEKKSSLSLKQAIDYGIQIAEGLAAAHEKGIVHRDIKPENIMIRKDGIVQVMDFGLAKLRGATRLTKEGSTVGTAGYMSPEQIQGADTDHRSDIFSLGVLLYEMLTGQPPFKGIHETAVSYEVVNVDSQPMSSIKVEIPPELDAIVLDCLEKDPNERTQAASQVALELKRYRRESSRQRASRITAARPVAVGTLSRESTTHPTGQESIGNGQPTKMRFFIAGGFVLALCLGFGGALLLPGTTIIGPTVRGSLESPDGVRFDNENGGHSVISPDGALFAFVGIDTAMNAALYVRPLNSTAATKLAGTENAEYPFWSPDNKSIAFFAGGKLKRVDVSGSPPLTVADAPTGRGGAWSPEGVIVFSPEVSQKDLFIVPASGGTAKPLTDLDSTSGAVPRFPFFLPDGKHFLFVSMTLNGGNTVQREDYQAWVGGIDGSVVSLPLKGASNMYYASGTLLYLRQGTLIGQPFDPETYQFKGEPVPFDNNVNFWPARAKGDFSVSGGGILLFGVSAQDAVSELLWFDREGRQTVVTNARPRYLASIAPDANVIAFDELQLEDGNLDIWLYDLGRKVKTRFTFNASEDLLPVWKAKGEMVFFTSKRNGSKHFDLYAKLPGGTKDEELIASLPDQDIYPTASSPDGRYLLLTTEMPATKWDLAYLDLVGERKVIPILATKYTEGLAVFSPDGKWLAYASDESGRMEVYVRPFLREGSQWQVSSGGAELVGWSAAGEIFIVSSGALMAVRVDISGSTPRFSVPSELFRIGNETGLDVRDITRDGKRFLVSRSAVLRKKNSHSMIVNWQAIAGGQK